jgi:hypothetical protein
MVFTVDPSAPGAWDAFNQSIVDQHNDHVAGVDKVLVDTAAWLEAEKLAK